MRADQHFEAWWDKKTSLLPPNLKAMFKIAYLDGFYRAERVSLARGGQSK